MTQDAQQSARDLRQKKMRTILIAAVVGLTLSGCNMTPQQQDAFRQNFNGTLGGMAQIQQNNIDQRNRQIQSAPQPQPSRSTTCRRNAWDGSITCSEW